MIIDHIEYRERYYPLGMNIERALRHLAVTDFTDVEPGRYEIDGKDIFVIVEEYSPLKAEEKQLEAHRLYIDVQYIVEGTEKVGYAPLQDQELIEDRLEKDDIAFYEGEEMFVTLGNKKFCILFPEDLHKPGIFNCENSVKKVVVKVAI